MQTEQHFVLPVGYRDASGTVHQQGTLRLATARDEIEAVGHPAVQVNDAYLPVILLSRVITQLGNLTEITPAIIEGLYAADLAYLEDLYLRMNSYESVLLDATCPHCGGKFRVQVSPLGEAED